MSFPKRIQQHKNEDCSFAIIENKLQEIGVFRNQTNHDYGIDFEIEIEVDHLQTSMACQEAIRLAQRRPEVKPLKEFWYMEVPSCTEWAINSAMKLFAPNCYVEVGPDGVQAKVKALSMYRGVMRPYPHPRSEAYITGLAAYRGSQFQLDYAEAFEVVLRKY